MVMLQKDITHIYLSASNIGSCKSWCWFLFVVQLFMQLNHMVGQLIYATSAGFTSLGLFGQHISLVKYSSFKGGLEPGFHVAVDLGLRAYLLG